MLEEERNFETSLLFVIQQAFMELPYAATWTTQNRSDSNENEDLRRIKLKHDSH